MQKVIKLFGYLHSEIGIFDLQRIGQNQYSLRFYVCARKESFLCDHLQIYALSVYPRTSPRSLTPSLGAVLAVSWCISLSGGLDDFQIPKFFRK